MKNKTRIEKDSLGERELDFDTLYGIQTLRSKENYQISGTTILPEIIKAYGLIKKSSAQTNMELKKLDTKIGNLIIKASEEVISGKLNKYFIVDVFQAGAGTATHMNVNEVIANRILEYMGEDKGQYNKVSPNDHVNMSQSTNDTYPTAMRLAVLSKYKKLDEALKRLETSFHKKADEFKDVIKSGRTHLQDAVPITLGQEFKAWGDIMGNLRKKLELANESLQVISIGGSAIGTGINTHKNYSVIAVEYLKENSGLELKASPNKIASTQSQIEILEYAGVLKQISIEISRICSDLKLLSSGPNIGLGEITLKPVQPGSSIMPGKVNPSIIEAMRMICYRVVGSEASVSYCVHGGHLELNTNMPLMSYELITSINILTNGMNMLSSKCIDDITANIEVCKNNAYNSSSLATILNPILGYSKVASLVKEQIKTKKPITKIILEKGLLSESELDEIMKPSKLTEPGDEKMCLL